MRQWIFAGAAVCVFAGLAFSQLHFDVASINASNPDSAASDSLYTDHSGSLHTENYPLRGIILFAYDLRDFELTDAPGWIETARYDILAKTESGKTDDDQVRERIQALLASRFSLRAHHEAKELTSYALTVAKGGPKLKVVTVPGEQLGFRGSRGHNQGFAITMPMFAKELGHLTGRPVIDRTELAGKYDYVLEWSLDADASGGSPTIFTALQEQLGLRLESVKAAVDTLVIDHIERPSKN